MALTTYAARITPEGIIAPTFEEIYADLIVRMKAIFGEDIYLAPDSQDGQMLAIFARAYADMNDQFVATYNSFSPSYAQGAGLSSVVKINGLRRLVASNSQAVGNVVGVTGTVITNGVVADINGKLWNLPAIVTIPVSGTIAVTAVCLEPGAVQASIGQINKIQTPTLGWQTFSNSSDAVPGNPVETDLALRQRQTVSTSLPAITPLGATQGAIANLAGVSRVRLYENDTGITDSNGLPPHSICAVVEGGSVQDIVDAVGRKKTPGCETFGGTSGTYTDSVTGIAYTINFDVLASEDIEVEVTIAALTGFSNPIKDEIKAAIVAYLNALDIGETVQFNRLFGAAYLNGLPNGRTYEITGMTINIAGDPPGVIDLPIDFNAAATCVEADVTIVGP